jgi:hypothetical protein
VDRYKSRYSIYDKDNISTGLWQLRDFNYSEIFTIPAGDNVTDANKRGSLGDGGAKVAIVFIDTTTLAPSENKCCNENG